MTIQVRPGRLLLASTLALTIPLAGCFGTSEDKGDNHGQIFTPKPSTVQDANSAGESKTPLPSPPGESKPKPEGAADAPPK